MENDEAVGNVRKQRPTWAKSWDFVFAAVGWSVGIGNVWRFPYLCFKHGGGAFLIPYFIFAMFIAIPCLILDSSLGQRSRRGLLQCWTIAPIFKGIALAQFVLLLHHNISYPIVLVWALKYLVKSFSAVLPWDNCNNPWNSANCIAPSDIKNMSLNAIGNKTISAGLEFWRSEVLHISAGIEHLGNIVPDLALYLFILWLCFYFCTFKGIKWTAKIVYVTASMPIILLIIILCRSVQLEGAANGIRYFMTPDLAKLADFKVWGSACSQVLLSNGPGLGTLISLGSFNDYHYNFWRDAFIIVMSNICTSIVGGFAVFSTLGFMANYQNTTVENVATSGPGLAFVVYPETLSLLPLPQLWCVLFFLMILALGFDTQFVCQETLVTVILDNCRKVREHRYGREIAQAVLCTVLMLLCFPMVTEGGVYFLELHSNYSIAGWCWLLIVTCECVAVAWCYGFDRYWNDIVDMVGEKWGRLWIKISWQYLAPLTCTVIAIHSMANLNTPTYNGYTYPVWAEVLGHITSFSSVVFIPGYAIYKILKCRKNGGTLKEIFSAPVQDTTKQTVELESLQSSGKPPTV